MRVDLTMVLRKYDQDQSKFVCFNSKENIPKNHLCFVIDEVVENLDFSSVHEKYEGTAGNPAYNHKIFIKIDFMGLIDGIFSSRKIYEQTYYNNVYKFLAGSHKPDFRTFCEARKENKELYKKAVIKTVAIGKELGLVTFNHISNDGTFFKANASNRSLFSKEDLKMINTLIEKMIEVDEEENLYYDTKNKEIVNKKELSEKSENKKEYKYDKSTTSKKTSDKSKNQGKTGKNKVKSKSSAKAKKETKFKKISKKVKKVVNEVIKEDKQTIKKLDKAEKILDERGVKKVNMIDSEYFSAYNKDKVYQQLYNIQFICDYDSKFILTSYTSNSSADHNQLIPILNKLSIMYPEWKQQNAFFSIDSIYNTGKNLKFLKNEDIEALIPSKYQASQNKNEKHKKEHPYHKNNFKIDLTNNEIICPEEKTLPFQNEYNTGIKVFYNTKACKNCKNKKQCTKSPTRIISIYPHEDLRQKMSIKMEMDEFQDEYKKRASTAESPIGDIKHNMRVREFNTRGTEYADIMRNKVSIIHNMKLIKGYLKKIKINTTKINFKCLKNLKITFNNDNILLKIKNELTILFNFKNLQNINMNFSFFIKNEQKI